MNSYNYVDFDYLNDEDRKRLSRMLMLSRAQSGLSQEKVALELGIAKKTVQNWEKGTSSPTLPQAIAWFRVMDIPSLPYLLQFIFPDIEGIKSKDSDDKIKKELINLIDSLPSECIRQLMYLFYGNHGSSPRGVMNMVTAHLQTPMKDRYNHACEILNDYKLSKEKNQTTHPEHIQPDVELLERAIEEGRKAVINDKNNYSLFPKSLEDSN